MLIVGEPGIGKSRLIEEFRAKLAETPHTWVEWAASQLLQNTPLHPLAEWGRLRFGGADASDEQTTRRPREHFASDRPRPGRICAPARAAGRHSVARGPRGEIRAGGIAATATGGDDGLVSGGCAVAAGRARFRGPALGRPDLARSLAGARRARRAGAAAHRGDDPARVPPALEPALAPQRHFARAARPRAGRAHGRRDRRPTCAFRRDDRGSGRANGRRPAVRRGGDATPARARRAGRRTGDPADLAAIPCRAPRPARASARGRADRRGAGTRFCLYRCCATLQTVDEPALQAALDRLAEADLLFVEGAPPERRLPFQARADPGRGLREPAQEPPPGAASPRCRGAARRRTPSPKRSPIISPRPASTILPSNGGARRATRLCAARPSRRRSPISARRSRWRTGRAYRGGGQRAARPLRRSI